MEPIFLIGFMGAGKTTLGRALAERCRGVAYVDLDDLIEQREGMPVREIFARHGEAYFRSRETELLREAAAREDVIIGCGGGTPCHSGNMDWMNGHGLTVLLQASVPVLLRRLLEAQAQRPLLAGMSPEQVEAFIVAKLAERSVEYERARLRFSSDRLETAGEIADSCRKFFEMIRVLTPNMVDDADC